MKETNVILNLEDALQSHQASPNRPVDIFGILEIGGNEATLSNSLVWLFRDNQILHKVAGRLFEWAGLPRNSNEEFIFQREVWLRADSRPDILIRTATAALAIEVKLFTSESEGQLRRYQRAMKGAFPNCNNALILLSRSGNKPITNDARHKIRVASLSYSQLADMIAHATRMASSSEPQTSDATSAAKLITNGFRSVGGAHMDSSTALKFWVKWPQELDDLTRLTPDLSAFRKDYCDGIAKIASNYGMRADQEYLPLSWKPESGRLQLREIKHYLEFANESHPRNTQRPCIVFGWYPQAERNRITERRPFVRLFVWRSGADLRNAKKLAGVLAARVPKADFDGALPAIRGWSGWGRLLFEDDFPEKAVVHGTTERAVINSAVRLAESYIRRVASAKSFHEKKSRATKR